MSLLEFNNVYHQYTSYHGSDKSWLKNIFFKEKKVFKSLKNLSFSINERERIGYIGLNGAGKSTTIKIATGIMKPISGSLLLMRKNPFIHCKKLAKKITVMFGHRSQLWWELPAIESFKFFKTVYNLSESEYQESLKFFETHLDLKHIVTKQLRALSLGQRMRCEFAAAFLHMPHIAFLDESTIGLDIEAKDAIKSAISELTQKHGMSFFITSHDLDDIEDICTRVIIIDDGQIIFNGTIDQVKKEYTNYFEVILVGVEEYDKNKQLHNGISIISSTPEKTVFRFNPVDISQHQVIPVIFNKYKAKSFTITEPSLKDVIRSINSGKKRAYEKNNFSRSISL